MKAEFATIVVVHNLRKMISNGYDVVSAHTYNYKRQEDSLQAILL